LENFAGKIDLNILNGTLILWALFSPKKVFTFRLPDFFISMARPVATDSTTVASVASFSFFCFKVKLAVTEENFRRVQASPTTQWS
jgi:hypothetical protein